jgi:hypothetical protein
MPLGSGHVIGQNQTAARRHRSVLAVHAAGEHRDGLPEQRCRVITRRHDHAGALVADGQGLSDPARHGPKPVGRHRDRRVPGSAVADGSCGREICRTQQQPQV